MRVSDGRGRHGTGKFRCPRPIGFGGLGCDEYSLALPFLSGSASGAKSQDEANSGEARGRTARPPSRGRGRRRVGAYADQSTARLDGHGGPGRGGRRRGVPAAGPGRRRVCHARTRWPCCGIDFDRCPGSNPGDLALHESPHLDPGSLWRILCAGPVGPGGEFRRPAGREHDGPLPGPRGHGPVSHYSCRRRTRERTRHRSSP